MLDFDEIDEWAPKFADALKKYVSSSVQARLASAAPQYIEDARDLLFELTNRDAIIDIALMWLRSSIVVGYHGTRLTDAEVASVRALGLVPLKAEARRDRLMRALSLHPRWEEVASNFDATILAHGHGNRVGRREGQVHLTLSRSGLTTAFDHYLTHGAEFDQQVAHALLGAEGVQLLARDGEPRLVRVAVPGPVALDAAHPYLGIDDLRARGDVPNLVHELLKTWAYRLAYPAFQARTLKVDCGMVFQSTVPVAWVTQIETLPSDK